MTVHVVTMDAGRARAARTSGRGFSLRGDWRFRASPPCSAPTAALLRGCQLGDESAVVAALSAGAAANACDREFSALAHAALRGHARIVRLLLDANADADAIGPGAEAAAECALRGGHIVLHEELVNHHLRRRDRQALDASPVYKAGAVADAPKARATTAVPPLPCAAPAPAIVSSSDANAGELGPIDERALEVLEAQTPAALQRCMQAGDDGPLRRIISEEARLRRAQAAGLMRIYDDVGGGSRGGASRGAAEGACDTMVIAFGGLQQRVGGGHGGGVPPYEFVRSCQRAGARHALFVRDPTRSWYLRGVSGDDGGASDVGGVAGARLRAAGGSWSFGGMVSALRAEVRRLRPRRVVTIGSSMGGYAAVRAGIELGVDLAIAFSPQVLVDPTARTQAALGSMHFDDLLSWLRVVGGVEGFDLTSLVQVRPLALRPSDPPPLSAPPYPSPLLTAPKPLHPFTPCGIVRAGGGARAVQVCDCDRGARRCDGARRRP